MTNPLLAEWDTPFGIPPFDRFAADDFEPAFDEAVAAWRAEVEAVATDEAAPTFANTIEALERAGRPLDRVSAVFFNLCSSDTNEALQAVEAKVSPMLAKAGAEVYLDPRLFARVDALADDGLSPEQARVRELYHDSFVNAGARLDEAGRARMAEIAGRLASLGAEFAKRLLEDEAAFELVLDEGDLEGLPDEVRDAMAGAAAARGHEGRWVVTATRSSVEPFLKFSARRDLREKAWRGFAGRGADRAETATADILSETLSLRAERARLLGHDSFAAFKLKDQMARTPENVRGLLQRVWEPAVEAAARDREALRALAAEEGVNEDIQPWDWSYWAEKRRMREHDLDEAALRPYLSLDRMIEAAFDTASRLFGLSFRELPDAPRIHADARVWEVRDGERHVGVFMGDYFARPSKRSGAWASALRSQRKLDGEQRPIIMNTCNFIRPASGPALLTFDDARTLFHEFGHALHGLTSDVTYPRIAGTRVARDFVELPSQLYEHWLAQPEVLGRFATHVETGEPMPEALLERLLGALTFDMGRTSVEYLASAFVDLEMHSTMPEGADPLAFEAEVLERIGMPEGIAMRHRSPHFMHVFAGDGYASGYYSYLWSEVMDADAFGAFEEAGDPFDAQTAGRLLESIYSAGGRQRPEEAYRAFRGRDPEVDSLLRRRGLLEEAGEAA